MDNREKWYVIQTRTGHEDQVCEACSSRLEKRGIRKIFVPKIELKKKYHGEWRIEKKPMYPGYIFMSVNEVEAKAENTDKYDEIENPMTGQNSTDLLFLDLKKIPYLTKLLCTDRTVVALEESDVLRVKSFIGEGDVAELSIGVIEGDKVKIFEGPLKGQEGLITRIDRHRRTAKVETRFLGEKRVIEVGLEIVSKNN